jgi:hypothetical protein
MYNEANIQKKKKKKKKKRVVDCINKVWKSFNWNQERPRCDIIIRYITISGINMKNNIIDISCHLHTAKVSYFIPLFRFFKKNTSKFLSFLYIFRSSTDDTLATPIEIRRINHRFNICWVR